MVFLLFFAGSAVLACLSLCRLTTDRWIALIASLLAFSSYYLLYYNDMIATENGLSLFGVLLTFHGMVLFAQEGRFRQLLVKACAALLLGWHVYALLLPFIVLGMASELNRARRTTAGVSLPHVVVIGGGFCGLCRGRAPCPRGRGTPLFQIGPSPGVYYPVLQKEKCPRIQRAARRLDVGQLVLDERDVKTGADDRLACRDRPVCLLNGGSRCHGVEILKKT